MPSGQEEIEEIAALALAPLVEVAWADGVVTPGERAAIFEASKTLGLDQRSEFCRSTLKRWLHTRPPSEEFARWRELLVPTLRRSESRPARKIARRLLGEAIRVAKMDVRPFDEGASFASDAGIPEEEQRVLDAIEAVMAELADDVDLDAEQ